LQRINACRHCGSARPVRGRGATGMQEFHDKRLLLYRRFCQYQHGRIWRRLQRTCYLHSGHHRRDSAGSTFERKVNMRTDQTPHTFSPRVGDSWCKRCNCTAVEHASLEFLDLNELRDYLSTQGVKSLRPTERKLAYTLWSQGDDYATIAHEIAFRRKG
jgi:hypothetical protein